MTRIPSLPIALALCAASVLALSACSRQSEAPQPATASAAQSSQTAAPSADTAQPPAADQSAAPAAPAQSAPADASQTAAGSPSLEHLAAVPASAALPTSSEWKPGVNYTVITPAQPTTVAPGKIEVMEVFWLACPHCYALEPYIQQWLKTKPSYVDFVRVPVMWGPVHRAHARLYYTLEALGRGDLVDKAFAYLHNLETQTGTESVLVSSDKQQTFKEQQAWAQKNGIKPDAFAQAYDSFYVNTQLQQAQETMNAYQVQEVPFIAVDGKFSTNVEQAGGPQKLISLIDFLAAWEHDHKRG